MSGDPEEVTPKMEQKFDIRNYIVSSDKRNVLWNEGKTSLQTEQLIIFQDEVMEDGPP